MKRLEARIAQLEKVIKTITFVSDAPVVTVQVPVPVLDLNGNPTGEVTTGYLQIKTGPAAGEIRISDDRVIIVTR